MTNSTRKDTFEGIQEEHRKILETIESALQKLNSVCSPDDSTRMYHSNALYMLNIALQSDILLQERTHIFEQYNSKVQKLSEQLFDLENNKADRLTIMGCQEELLIAKREMLQWNKTNKKTQIDITVKQISTIQSQLDGKNADLQEVIARELQELKNVSILDEVVQSSSILHHRQYKSKSFKYLFRYFLVFFFE